MARRKKSSKKPENIVDIKSLSIVLIGIIFAFIIYSQEMGTPGHVVKNTIIGGLMGKVAYFFPFVLIIFGIYLVFKDYSKFKLKITPFIILFVSIAALITVYHYPTFDGDMADYNIFQKIIKITNDSQAFNSNDNAGGGLIGAIPAVILAESFNLFIAKLIIYAILIIITCIVTGIAFPSIVIGIRDFISEVSASVQESIEQARLEREERLEREALEAEQDELEEENEEELQRELERDRKSKKFRQIMEQTDELDSGKQISISELELDDIDIAGDDEKEYEEEQEQEVEEEEEEEQEIEPVIVQPKKKRILKSTVQKEEPAPQPILESEEDNEDYDDYLFPPISLLNEGDDKNNEYSVKELRDVATKLQNTLTSFNVDARVVNVTRGPTVTQYEVQPNSGVKVSKILSLSDDIALNLAAKSIRIEAPIPGKMAVGIEVPNKSKEIVYLRDVIASETFKKAKSKVSFALGKSIDGEPLVADIAKMPHLLIAGSTGSGKSVCINSILVSLLYKAKPNEVKLILIDPKVVELGVYNDIPHLLLPVVTNAKKAVGALNLAVQEMENRYQLFAAKGVRDIRGYNDVLTQEGGEGVLPQIVIIVDELADLMMVAPSEAEESICRLAQMARAAGLHLIIATQRPSVDIVTGIIKANIPSRIAFTVSSQVDSRTILDMGGAEKLLGKGDMLYYPMGEEKPVRVQGTFISDKEIESIVDYVKDNYEAKYDPNFVESFEKQNQNPQQVQEQQADTDELLTDAIELAVKMGNASASMIQRKFKVGYARAGRIIDQMEERGIVSGYDGSKPRQTLISQEEWEEMKEAGVDSVRFEEVDEDEYEEETEDDDSTEYEDEYVEEDDSEEIDEDAEYDEEAEEEAEDDDTNDNEA